MTLIVTKIIFISYSIKGLAYDEVAEFVLK